MSPAPLSSLASWLMQPAGSGCCSPGPRQGWPWPPSWRGALDSWRAAALRLRRLRDGVVPVSWAFRVQLPNGRHGSPRAPPASWARPPWPRVWSHVAEWPGPGALPVHTCELTAPKAPAAPSAGEGQWPPSGAVLQERALRQRRAFPAGLGGSSGQAPAPGAAGLPWSWGVFQQTLPPLETWSPGYEERLSCPWGCLVVTLISCSASSEQQAASRAEIASCTVISPARGSVRRSLWMQVWVGR